MDLHNIIMGCINNDRICQKHLYDHCYAYGLKVALAYCSDYEEAREVLNDAFLKMFSNLDKYNAAFSFLPWFRVFIIRTAINHFHKAQNNIKLMELTTELQLITDDDNGLSQLEANELLNLTNLLPPAYKMALNLYALEGYTHAEIADLLNITIGTSKSNLSKARTFLSKLIVKNKFLVFF